LGFKVGIVTGDRKRVAEKIGNELGVDVIISEVLPTEKAKVVRDFQEKENFIQLIKGIQSKLGSNFSIPIFVKFAPDLSPSYFEELLEIMLSFHLNGVIVTNTTIDKTVLKHYSPEKIEEGGISGLVLAEKSTKFVRIARKILQGRIPIIGVGGIFSPELALKKILAGADLIQIYTGYIYKGPFFPYIILEYLDKFLEKEGVNSIQEIVGQEQKSQKFF
ncbi:MAG: hypothetical protein N3A69_00660, partial [Leptospiraceae bacterium]|nr:hypothetical protein [Leptospiraceae bacterium]